MKTPLTLRRSSVDVSLIAIHPDHDKMAIRMVPVGELSERHELTVRKSSHVRGHCLLTGMTESVDVDLSLESAEGGSIGSLTTRRELTPDGLRVDYQLRLPPGDYVLKSRESPRHAGFTIPFTVPEGTPQLDLGTRGVPISAKGKR
jgi:hypothetical protein